MKSAILLDAGPLVALVDRSERHHEWAAAQLAAMRGQLMTCEAVIAEALFLVRRHPPLQGAILAFLERGALELPFRLAEESTAVARLMERYASVPMSLADACLVRMSEQHGNGPVVTLDSDFRIYRRHGRQAIPVVAPAYPA